jgi:uncharacterized protein YjgD (DUF1641 family)
MQTSIEWFIEHLLGNGLLRLTKEDHSLYSELRDIAKEMHKQEIIDAYYQCARDNFEHIKVINRSATEYYQETFKKD